jgi:hypothetical protein
MTCFVFAGSAPSAKTLWLKGSNAASMSGARARRFCESPMAADQCLIPRAPRDTSGSADTDRRLSSDVGRRKGKDGV